MKPSVREEKFNFNFLTKHAVWQSWFQVSWSPLNQGSPDAGDASEDGGRPRFSRQSLSLVGGHSPAGEIGGDALLSFTTYALLARSGKYTFRIWEICTFSRNREILLIQPARFGAGCYSEMATSYHQSHEHRLVGRWKRVFGKKGIVAGPFINQSENVQRVKRLKFWWRRSC